MVQNGAKAVQDDAATVLRGSNPVQDDAAIVQQGSVPLPDHSSPGKNHPEPGEKVAEHPRPVPWLILPACAPVSPVAAPVLMP